MIIWAGSIFQRAHIGATQRAERGPPAHHMLEPDAVQIEQSFSDLWHKKTELLQIQQGCPIAVSVFCLDIFFR